MPREAVRASAFASRVNDWHLLQRSQYRERRAEKDFRDWERRQEKKAAEEEERQRVQEVERLQTQNDEAERRVELLSRKVVAATIETKGQHGSVRKEIEYNKLFRSDKPAPRAKTSARQPNPHTTGLAFQLTRKHIPKDTGPRAWDDRNKVKPPQRILWAGGATPRPPYPPPYPQASRQPPPPEVPAAPKQSPYAAIPYKVAKNPAHSTSAKPSSPAAHEASDTQKPAPTGAEDHDTQKVAEWVQKEKARRGRVKQKLAKWKAEQAAEAEAAKEKAEAEARASSLQARRAQREWRKARAEAKSENPKKPGLQSTTGPRDPALVPLDGALEGRYLQVWSSWFVHTLALKLRDGRATVYGEVFGSRKNPVFLRPNEHIVRVVQLGGCKSESGAGFQFFTSSRTSADRVIDLAGTSATDDVVAMFDVSRDCELIGLRFDGWLVTGIQERPLVPAQAYPIQNSLKPLKLRLDSGARDVAVQGIASQSTSVNAKMGAGLAIRGYRYSSTGFKGQGEYAHTHAVDKAPSWQVALPRAECVERINIYGRPGYGRRLQNVRVTLQDAEGDRLFHIDIANVEKAEAFEVDFGAGFTGVRIVKLSKVGPLAHGEERTFNLNAVQVFAAPHGQQHTDAINPKELTGTLKEW